MSYSITQQHILQFLKADIALDADICPVEVSSVNGHVDISSPCLIAPFDIQAVVGAEVSGETGIFTKTTLPFDTQVSLRTDGTV